MLATDLGARAAAQHERDRIPSDGMLTCHRAPLGTPGFAWGCLVGSIADKDKGRGASGKHRVGLCAQEGWPAVILGKD